MAVQPRPIRSNSQLNNTVTVCNDSLRTLDLGLRVCYYKGMKQLNHHFVYQCEEWETLLKCRTLNQLRKSIVTLGQKQDPDFYDPLKYMGDAWETICEFYLKYFEGDSTTHYSYDYRVNDGVDKGIDGFATSTLDGALVTVQCKFAADPKKLLGNDANLGNHLTDSGSHSDWVDDNRHAILFTSGGGVSPRHAYHGRTIVLDAKTISRRIDGNLAFWTRLRESVLQTVTEA